MLKSFTHFWRSAAQRYWRRKRHVEDIAGLTLVLILVLKFTGLLQYPEWIVLSWLYRVRGADPVDERVIVVGLDDQDIQAFGWPLSDQYLVDLLDIIDQGQPRAIGLDIYRDEPVLSGHEALSQFFAANDSIIGIQTLSTQTLGPEILTQKDQVGFNDVAEDQDGIVRRNFLYGFVEDQPYESFALKLAKIYLAEVGIEPVITDDVVYLGKGKFVGFRLNDGPYANPQAPGYQTLANFRGEKAIQSVSQRDVMAGRVDPEIFRDRIVLIGYTASSVRDFFETPLSHGGREIKRVSGVEVHADFVSQIVAAAIDGRPNLTILPNWLALIWVGGWIYLGAWMGWTFRRPRRWAIAIGMLMVATVGSGVTAFISGSLWLPVAASVGGSGLAALLTTTDRLQQTEKLRKSTEFLSSVINTIPDPIFVKDEHYRWIAVNQAYCNFVGYSFEQLFQKTALEVFQVDQAQTFTTADKVVMQSGTAEEHEESFTDAAGHTYQIATKRSLHRDAAGNLFLVGIIRDITNRKRLENELRRTALELRQENSALQQTQGKLKQLAYRDALTGLPNRERFRELFDQAVEWAIERDRMLGLLFLDLDGFKQVNDNHGHDVGDLLLQAVAGRLTGCLRGSDIVSRLGGDEFVILLPGIPSLDDAGRVADKVLVKLAQPFGLDGTTVTVTASIGISFYPHQGTDFEQLLKAADTNMYEAKRVGKNQYAMDATVLPPPPSLPQEHQSA